MSFLKPDDHGNVVVPVRTEAHPSPTKQAASNRQPGQSHTRTTVDEAINHELAKARYLMDDLADHVFGHIVSTELAKDILCHFVENGIVEIFEGAASRSDHTDKAALDPNSEDVQRAIQQAFEDADEHDYIRLDTDGNSGEPELSPIDTKKKGKQTDSKGKGKRKQKQKQQLYSFNWCKFPAEPIKEDELVSFLNEITDHAYAFAKPMLSGTYTKLNHRFAAREDQHHAMLLSYEPDGEDMRPDFLVLPIEAFKHDFKTVDRRYINFTASRLVGESKNKDLAAGVEQVQRYARGLKRAQPWVQYVLALTITRDKAVLLRGEGSGTERLELMLGDGRGCIELIRILLGLGLADKVDLGHNPEVELEEEARMCGNPLTTTSRARGTAAMDSIGKSSSEALRGHSRTCSGSATSMAPSATSHTRKASAASKVFPISSRTRSASATLKNIPSSSRTPGVLRQQVASSTSSKRAHSEIAEGNQDENRRKRCKVAETAIEKREKVVFFFLYACMVTHASEFCLPRARFGDAERRYFAFSISMTRT